MSRIKQLLNKSLFRHAGECQHPVNNGFYWVTFITLIAWLLVINTPFVFAATGRILEGIEAEQADKKALVAEANIFKSIGMGIALSLAQCEGQDQCQVIDADEIEQLLGALDIRINNLILRQGGGEGEYTEVLTVYIDQREKYLKYQDKLEEIIGTEAAVDETAQDAPETQAFGTDEQEGGVDLSIFEDVEVEEDLGGEEKFEDDFSPEDP